MFKLTLPSQWKAELTRLNTGQVMRFEAEYENLARLISFTNLHENDVRLAFCGENIPTRVFCNSRSAVGNNALVDLYFAGSTVILQRANRFSEDIERLRRGLEDFSGAQTHVNAYLTPANTSGVGFHRDEYDVLIFQLHGEKVWITRHLRNQDEFSLVREGEFGYLPSSLV